MNASTKEDRIKDLRLFGYPAYTTQVGWMGYSDEKVKSLCKEYLSKGYTAFKIKVGRDFDSDFKRCTIMRETIGWDNLLMLDANQVWEVKEAENWVSELADFKPLWIEEPTSPDDVLGHATIAKNLKQYGIGVATGEMCANRVMFKQFLQSKAIQFCQVDAARIGGVNELLLVYLLARKFKVKVCPHAGGVGLCEMVQHLQMWDFVSLSATKIDRMIEYVDQQHDQFVYPVVIKHACYMPPLQPGYSTRLKPEAIAEYKYPDGTWWKQNLGSYPSCSGVKKDVSESILQKEESTAEQKIAEPWESD